MIQHMYIYTSTYTDNTTSLILFCSRYVSILNREKTKIYFCRVCLRHFADAELQSSEKEIGREDKCWRQQARCRNVEKSGGID